MVGLRYGTVPVVRSVGGMVDTVFDRDYSPRAPHERNGYAFEHVDNPAIESALSRAIRLWFDQPVEFRGLIDSAMRADNSWNRPGRQYLDVYEHIRRDRRAVPGLDAAPQVPPARASRARP